MDDRERTVKLINTLWPSVKVIPSNVTPDVSVYVYSVFLAAKEGHQIVKALGSFVGPITSPNSALFKLGNAVRKYTDHRQDWGLAIRAGVAAHQRHIQAAMTYGTDTYPLTFR